MIPMDGTFDQEAPLRRLVAECSGATFHSYDLSAATDRLPIALQIQILDCLLPGFGTA